MYQAVFLDIDNTLLSFTAAAQDAMRTGMAKLGRSYADDIWPLFQRINNDLWQRLERGELTPQQLYRIRWGMIFDALGWQEDGPAFEELFRAGLHESAVPEPGALQLLAVLDALRPGVQICAASNGPFEQQRHRLELAGMLHCFDHLFISEAVGFSKPDARFFDHAFAVLNAGRTEEEKIRPESCLMIGDSLTADISGAAAYGMHTCWFNSENKPCPGNITPTFTVTALEEIAALL